MLAGFGLLAPIARAEVPRGSVGWQYSESGRGYYQPPQGEPAPSQPPGPNDWVEQVLINQPEWDCQGAGIGNCDPLSIWCNPDLTPDVRQPIYVRSVLRYQWKDRDDRAKWQGTADCYPTPEWVPIEQISYDFKYEIQRELPAPTIELRPNPKTFVNLPTIVSAPDPGPQDFEIVVPPSQGRTFPLRGQIHAEPDYTWTFEGGKTVKGPGRPFDGTLPEDRPGYYVTNTFSTTGQKNVHLRVRWTGTVTVDTLPPEPILPVEFEANTTIDVVEAKSVLER
ncbi:hypothetical protein [Actinopolymorpha alba]|uniref:hypothetical protein n=1 Tax=Actinopolymorpha alba TaxID=533267 RepID=UPI0012F6D382|nr:hypothetical protein [Actinopolymorpha alba]